MSIVDAFGNLWENITRPSDDSIKYKKTLKTKPARTFIKEQLGCKYKKKLLEALGLYLRYTKKVNFHEYTVQDLVNELDTIRSLRGVGSVTMNELVNKLKENGYL